MNVCKVCGLERTVWNVQLFTFWNEWVCWACWTWAAKIPDQRLVGKQSR